MYGPPGTAMSEEDALGFAAARGFGLLLAEGGDDLAIVPLPFEIVPGVAGRRLARFHVARANPVWTLFAAGEKPATLAVSGADHYVAPRWYASEGQGPTWLYVAVRLGGPARLMTKGETATHLASLTERFEDEMAPQERWSLDRLAAPRRAQLVKGLVGIEMEVARVEGRAKLNRHKSDADHEAVRRALVMAGSENA